MLIWPVLQSLFHEHVVSLDRVGTDRNLQHCWCSYSSKLLSSKLVGSVNPSIDVGSATDLLNRLYRLPICEPDGSVVYLWSTEWIVLFGSGSGRFGYTMVLFSWRGLTLCYLWRMGPSRSWHVSRRFH